MLVRARYIGEPIKHYKIGGLYIINLKDGVYSKAVSSRIDLSESTKNHLIQFESMEHLVRTWENISILQSKELKICKCCGKLKNISRYYVSAKNKDGHRGACMECEKRRSRKSMMRLLKKRKVPNLYVLKKEKNGSN